MEPELLMTTQASQLMNTPAATLRWWRYRGIGPRAFRLGERKVMYRRIDIERWVQDCYETNGANREAS